MYTVHLRLIGKLVVDFIVIIKLFLLAVSVEALRVNIDWKSPFLKRGDQFDPKFQVEGGRLPPTILRIGKLDEFSFHMV